MINDYNGGAVNRPDGETRRFAPAYKQAMGRIEVSDALRERILSTVPGIAAKHPGKQWAKAAGGVAACLVAVVAAGSLIPRVEPFSLTVEDNAACETVSSAAATAEAPPIGVSGSRGTRGTGISPEDAPAGADGSQPAAGDAESAVPGGVTVPDPTAGAEAVDGETSSESSQPAETALPEAEGDGLPAANSAAPYGVDTNALLPSAAEAELEELSPKGAAESGASGGSGADNAGLPNPMVDYPTAADVFAALGWSVELPEGMDGDCFVIDGDLFQLDTAEGGCFRAAQMAVWGDDISGDYNSYPYDVRIEMEGLSLRLRGETAGQASLVSWVADGFSYSYASPEPMNEKEAVDFAKTISG